MFAAHHRQDRRLKLRIKHHSSNLMNSKIDQQKHKEERSRKIDTTNIAEARWVDRLLTLTEH